MPKDSNIFVILRVSLDENGALESPPEVIQSSGYSEYDMAANMAVVRAAPLPMPKEKFIYKNARLLERFTELELHIRMAE